MDDRRRRASAHAGDEKTMTIEILLMDDHGEQVDGVEVKFAGDEAQEALNLWRELKERAESCGDSDSDDTDEDGDSELETDEYDEMEEDEQEQGP